MVDVFRLLGPVCLTKPDVCLYASNKLTTDDCSFEKNELYSILYDWAYTPTYKNLGTLTDIYWLGKSWLRVNEKHNNFQFGIKSKNHEHNVAEFTNLTKHLLSKFDVLIPTNEEISDEILNDIIKLKTTYRNIAEEV